MNTMAYFSAGRGAIASGLRGSMPASLGASGTRDATEVMSTVARRYVDLSTQGEKLRQILAAGGKVPCEVWNAYNQACNDYIAKSQPVFDQLAQRGITVDQVIYSGGQPVPDPSNPGSYRTLRVSAPLRPPAFTFVGTQCPGIATFQGGGGSLDWVPVPITAELGSIAEGVLVAAGIGALFILTGGTGAIVGAAGYAAYKAYQLVAVWIEDYYDPPARILTAYTDCFAKSTAAGMSADKASAQCSGVQTAAQKYAAAKAAVASWGFWSWVGVGTAVLVVGGILTLYLRNRMAGATQYLPTAEPEAEPSGTEEIGCGCPPDLGRARRSRRGRSPMLLGDLYLYPRG